MKPGDRQPNYQGEVVAKGREAAKLMSEFDRSIRSIQRAIAATPEEMERLTERIMERAEQEERGPLE